MPISRKQSYCKNIFQLNRSLFILRDYCSKFVTHPVWRNPAELEKNIFKYYLAVIAAFSIYGLFSIPLKAIDAFPSLDILLSRLLIASVCILIFSFTFRYKITLENIRKFQNFDAGTKREQWIVNISSSVFLAVNWYLFIYVMNRISVNATSLAYMLCPIITTVLAYIFLKDRLTKIQWTAVGLSLFSCLLLSVTEWKDVFYSFIVGFSYAIYLVLQKNNHKLDRFFTLTFQIVVGSILLLPFWGEQSAEPVKGVFFFSVIIVIAIFFTIIPMYLNVFALNRLSSSTAGIFIYLNPVLSFLLALLYFGEKMSAVKIFAYSLVFFSVILFNWNVIRLILKNTKTR